MRELKDSGIDFIGIIPNAWFIKKLKYIVQLRYAIYRLSDTNKYIGLENVESNSGHYIETGTEYDDGVYLGCEAGDLLYGKLRPNLAKVLMAPFRSCCSGEFVVIASSAIDLKYLQYYMLTDGFTQIVTGSTYGAKMPRANWDFIKNIKVVYPSKEDERNQIISILKSKCLEIDTVKTDILMQMELLDKYERSIVSEAVTKGLNSQVEMRESRIKWVPRLPAHWTIIPSKYLFKDSDLRRQNGDVQLTASQKYGIISQEEYMERENTKVVLANQGLEDWKHVEPYNFVISLRSFQGGLEMSEVTGCITWHYVVLKAAKLIYPQFYKWLFKSSVYITALQQTCNFIRDGQDLRYSNFSQVPLYEPPLEEQKEIADYLDKKCAEIDAVIATKQKQLETLDAYKKSLIYEYVTGKKEV